MAFCKTCGAQLADNAAVCMNCGTPVASTTQPQQGYAPQQGYVPQQQDSGLTTAAKVFMIIGTVFMGLYLIPLAWCIPMTVSYCKKVKYNQPISTGFKVCCLLFVSLLGGIFMLCDKNH